MNVESTIKPTQRDIRIATLRWVVHDAEVSYSQHWGESFTAPLTTPPCTDADVNDAEVCRRCCLHNIKEPTQRDYSPHPLPTEIIWTIEWCTVELYTGPLNCCTEWVSSLSDIMPTYYLLPNQYQTSFEWWPGRSGRVPGQRHGVSSRGASEGRLRSRGSGTSQYRGERRRRYSTSSSPDVERETDHHQSSPLAIPLQNGRFIREARHRTTSEFCSQSRDSSVERPRDREPQPSTSGCANAALGPMFVPPARNGQSLESGDSDDESSDRELSGEVRSILSSRRNVRQGVRSKALRADVTVHGNPDEPVDLHGDIHPENRQKRVRSCARVQLVTTICHLSLIHISEPTRPY